MMERTLRISFMVKSRDQLDSRDRELAEAAEEALKNAYAPYSNFKVGSAVRMLSGRIYGGNNQENAAYPSGLCAERVALFKARSETKEPVEALVVLAVNAEGRLADAFSCGNCRQVLMEYAMLQDTPVRILMRNRNAEFVVIEDVRELLPFSFQSAILK